MYDVRRKINPPCLECPRNYEVPKVCRSGCEKWKDYEIKKKQQYENKSAHFHTIIDIIEVQKNRDRRIIKRTGDK